MLSSSPLIDKARLLRQFVLLALFVLPAAAQVDTAQLLGRVIGPSGQMIPKARLVLTSSNQGVRRVVFSGAGGLYVFSNVHPGDYQLTVEAAGFRTVILRKLTLYTQQDVQQNFNLSPGSPLEALNVEATGTPVATTGTVGTVVDGSLVRELPLNGRSFQTLFQLTPGVSLTTTDFANRGQFSVNGQRSNSNAVFVDGVSANFDVSPGLPLGQSAGGSLPVVTAAGGTNALVSVDDVQEFVVLTSSFAPEFGRFSGGQVSIVTRSGGNKLHGSLSEYLRNDALDANDWFANKERLPRAALRQNDFGTALGGPIVKNSAFWFFSYEGLRLQQPTSVVTTVPSLLSRSLAVPAVRPFLDAYPLPTGPDQNGGISSAAYGFSNPSGLNSVSARVDVQPNQSLRLFGRYSQSESDDQERGAGSNTLSSVTLSHFNSQALTLGFSIESPNKIGDFRINVGRTSAVARDQMDNFGGAIRLPNPSFPSPFSSTDSAFQFTPDITDLVPGLSLGRKADNALTQLNVGGNGVFNLGNHSLKFGIDARRISPQAQGPSYIQQNLFSNIENAEIGQHAFAVIVSSVAVKSVFQNYSAFFQDSWSVTGHLHVVAGVRWEMNPALVAKGANDSLPVVVRGFGTPQGPSFTQAHTLYRTPLLNLAPRLGFAYSFGQTSGPIVQVGCGLFYDLGRGPAGNAVSGDFFPFSAERFVGNASFPLQGPDAAPPSLNTPSPPFTPMQAFPAELRLPYSAQWNVGLQQPLGRTQAVTATYVGSEGRQLLRTEEFIGDTVALPADFLAIESTNNAGRSRYDSLQVRYQSLGPPLHVIASYTLSHSRDNVSTDAVFNGIPSQFVNPKDDYSDSDFDIRHTMSVGLHYASNTKDSHSLKAALSGWSFDPILWYRSGAPVDVTVMRDIGFGTYNFRPDRSPGVPIYVSDVSAPGDRRLNVAAFSIPSFPRQGSLPRNVARGFSLIQMDLAITKQVFISHQVALKVKVEAFNVFNHPTFGPPSGVLGTVLADGSLLPEKGFGLSGRNFAQSLQTGPTGAKTGFSPLYQVGGARSLQLALRIEF